MSARPLVESRSERVTRILESTGFPEGSGATGARALPHDSCDKKANKIHTSRRRRTAKALGTTGPDGERPHQYRWAPWGSTLTATEAWSLPLASNRGQARL